MTGKCHQRLVREREAAEPTLFPFPQADIKRATLRELDHDEAKTIILRHEWLGTMGTTHTHYGIFFEGVLAGAVCFGFLQAMQGYATYVGEEFAEHGIQLTRGACAHWAHPHSGSKLIAYGLRRIREAGRKWVVAFSDPMAGEIGTLYQATNWHYLGFADHAPHFDIYHKRGEVYLNDRDLFRVHGFSGRKKISEFLADKPHLEMRVRYDKARYIKLTGSKRENREMLGHLKRHTKPYPKRGDSGEEPVIKALEGEGE